MTVCSPMCGCGATSIGLPSLKVSGPKRSRKHHGPTRRRSRIGSAREIVRRAERHFAIRIRLELRRLAPSATHSSAATISERFDMVPALPSDPHPGSLAQPSAVWHDASRGHWLPPLDAAAPPGRRRGSGSRGLQKRQALRGCSEDLEGAVPELDGLGMWARLAAGLPRRTRQPLVRNHPVMPGRQPTAELLGPGRAYAMGDGLIVTHDSFLFMYSGAGAAQRAAPRCGGHRDSGCRCGWRSGREDARQRYPGRAPAVSARLLHPLAVTRSNMRATVPPAHEFAHGPVRWAGGRPLSPGRGPADDELIEPRGRTFLNSALHLAPSRRHARPAVLYRAVPGRRVRQRWPATGPQPLRRHRPPDRWPHTAGRRLSRRPLHRRAAAARGPGSR